MKLYNLQVLRGISALLVCCFHFRQHLNINGYLIGDFLFKKGSIGVPIFFILSGFIMVYTTKKYNFSSPSWGNIKDFLTKRFIRIIPLYYITTFAWIILGGGIAYYLSGTPFERLWHSLIFFPQKNEFPVLYLGWSLNYEMFFYFIFAFSFFLKKFRYFFIILFFILALIIGRVYIPESAFLQMVSDPINLYFLLGILFGLYIQKIKMDPKYIKIFLFGAIILFLFYLSSYFPENETLSTYIIVAAFVLSFLLLDTLLAYKPHKFFIYLGDISFSLYLTHPFVEVFLKKIKIDDWLSVPYFIFTIGMVILVASTSYEIIEKRLTQILKSRI
ncbi:MAG: acyltransferase [Bacteroidetes bacterium]|nr:acyltransferase [Bacteroidota bacterium]